MYRLDYSRKSRGKVLYLRYCKKDKIYKYAFTCTDAIKHLSKHTTLNTYDTKCVLTFLLDITICKTYGLEGNLPAALVQIITSKMYKSLQFIYTNELKIPYLEMLNFFYDSPMLYYLAYHWDESFCKFLFAIFEDYEWNCSNLLYEYTSKESIKKINKAILHLQKYKPEVYELYQEYF